MLATSCVVKLQTFYVTEEYLRCRYLCSAILNKYQQFSVVNSSH